MANAKEEFLHMVKNETVLCAEISYQDCWEHESPGSQHTLKKGYTKAEYDAFLSKLDFEYHDGYGAQYVFGYVWLTNGVWMDRGEYDGSEWWQHHICPVVPKSLLGL